MARIRLVINKIKLTGAQIILSHLEGVIMFNTVATTENPKTTQINLSENNFQSGEKTPALTKAIQIKNNKIII